MKAESQETLLTAGDKSFSETNRIIKRNYEISLRNNKSQAVEVTLIDRIPIAQNVWALGAVADFGALNCQHTTKFDAR